jgi:hypothetical protein
MVPSRAITGVMRETVDLSREPQSGAVEIQHIGANWMLFAKAPIGALEPNPKQLLR